MGSDDSDESRASRYRTSESRSGRARARCAARVGAPRENYGPRDALRAGH